jgi:hypothetical protein
MEILTHIGPEDPFGFHHVIPALAMLGSTILTYVYLFWAEVRNLVNKLWLAIKKLFRRS